MSLGKADYRTKHTWPIISWPYMESWMVQKCECGCGGSFTADNPPELAVACHTGSPLYVAYWDGWLYCSCATCGQVVGRIEVNQRLLPEKGPS